MRAQNVMDNLIYRREIPVMIGVFINPGRRPDQPEPTPRNWGDRDTNRPTEYNSLDDRYARVITEELMPALTKDYNIYEVQKELGRGGIGVVYKARQVSLNRATDSGQCRAIRVLGHGQ
jgi:enterochelin esterase-like enzyme